MATSDLALARERLKIIAESIGFSGKAAVVPSIHAADLEFWKRYAPGEFKFFAVGESTLAFAGIDAPTAIHAYLYASSSSADGESVDDLVTQLKAYFIDAGNYPGGELVCAAVTFDAYETMLDEPSGPVLRAHLICYFPEV